MADSNKTRNGVQRSINYKYLLPVVAFPTHDPPNNNTECNEMRPIRCFYEYE